MDFFFKGVSDKSYEPGAKCAQCGSQSLVLSGEVGKFLMINCNDCGYVVSGQKKESEMQVAITEHVCSLNHCTRCGDCISPPRILCDVCRKVGFENQPQNINNTDHLCSCHLKGLATGVTHCPVHG